MSHELVHEEARNALEALALDALDASERAAVIAHVGGCSVCRADLSALENAAAHLAYAVRPVPMSDAARDRVKSRLMNRVSSRSAASESGARVETPVKPFQILVPHPAEDRRPDIVHISAKRAWWLAAAATLVAAVSLGSLYQVRQERDAATTAWRAASADRLLSRPIMDSLRANLADRDRVIANLTGPNVAVMTLASTGPNAPSARMFWNQSANAWTLVAHHLPKPLPGRTYQLWFVTKSQKISAGTFASGANGDAIMQATYALPKDAQLAALAVTDEPEAGSAQPTTTPVLLALASAR